MPNTQEDELRKKIRCLLGYCDVLKHECLFDSSRNEIQELDEVMAAIRLYAAKDYLSHFSYVDWEVGDDDQLRTGDYISCNFQDHNGQDTHTFEGKIVLHHGNNLPVVLYNTDPNDEENSGDYASLQGLFMVGYDFKRIKQLKKGQE